MSLLKAYLRQPSTQRILGRKPGEKGFSLIELVVVVAVLAILAAIAIPNFLSINDDARVSGVKNTLATLVKECAVKLARGGTGPAIQFTPPNLSSSNYTFSTTAAIATGKGTCSDSNTYTATPAPGTSLPTFIVTAGGEKTCSAAAGNSTNASLGCTAGTW